MLLKLERDENTCRKEMTASEMLDLARRLEALEKPKAEERKRDGWKEREGTLAPFGAKVPDPAPASHSSHYKVSEVIGPAVGLSACCRRSTARSPTGRLCLVPCPRTPADLLTVHDCSPTPSRPSPEGERLAVAPGPWPLVAVRLRSGR